MAKPVGPTRTPPLNPWIPAIAVMSSAIMEVIDTSVVNVSLPHIAGSLAASTDEATWVLTSYIVANAIILPISGWLASYFGRKRLLVAVVTGFTLSSVLCGLAPTLPALIFFRVLQGTTGGGLPPLSQAVLLEGFPVERRGTAMAFWGMGIIAAPILGPTLGGFITENYSWRWVFYINLPIGILSLTLISLYVFDPPYLRRPSRHVDGIGLGMMALGIASFQILLDKGQEADWFASRLMTMLAMTAVVTLTWFVIPQLRSSEPVVDFRLFKLRTFAAPEVRNTLQSLGSAVGTMGGSAAVTTRERLAVLYAQVQQQAALLSFVELFYALGIVFLLVTPLVWIMKRPQTAAGAAAAH